MPTKLLGSIMLDDGPPRVVMKDNILTMTNPVLGVDSSLVMSGYHLGFFDFDTDSEMLIRQGCEDMRDNDEYSSVLLKTKRGYHVIVPHELTIWGVVRVADQYFQESIDTKFLGMGLVRGFWTLRIGVKDGGTDIQLLDVFSAGTPCHRGIIELLMLLHPGSLKLAKLPTDANSNLTIRSYWA